MSTAHIFGAFLRWVRRSKQRITPKPSNIGKISRRNIVLCFPQSMHSPIQPEMEGAFSISKETQYGSMADFNAARDKYANSYTHRSELLYIPIRPISPAHRRSRFPSDSRPKGFRSACKSPDRRLANRRCAGSPMLTRRQPAGTKSTRTSSCWGAGVFRHLAQ